MKSIGKEIRGILKKNGIFLYQMTKDLGIGSCLPGTVDPLRPEHHAVQGFA
jgi:hypothetical protein